MGVHEICANGGGDGLMNDIDERVGKRAYNLVHRLGTRQGPGLHDLIVREDAWHRNHSVPTRASTLKPKGRHVKSIVPQGMQANCIAESDSSTHAALKEGIVLWLCCANE